MVGLAGLVGLIASHIVDLALEDVKSRAACRSA